MTSQIAFLDSAVADYLANHSTPPSEIEQRLIDRLLGFSGGQGAR